MKLRITLLLLLLFNFFFCSFSQKDSLNIVTWNIYMRPRLVMHDDQIERAKEIVKAVKNDSIDIIVFQEIFDRKARKIISKGLKDTYKYTAGPGKKGILKLNCGVMIFSKYPITNSTVVHFNDCKEADCLAKKGVVFSEIQLKENKKINLLGTHFQAIGGPVFRKIRTRQMELMNKTAEKNKIENTPIIFAGDFNIPENDSLFPKLLSVFKVKHKPIVSKRKFSSDNDNYYKQGDNGASLIDHIFLNENGTTSSLENIQVIRKQYYKDGKARDLSDHYLVKAKFIY